jgi:rhodanese-related sulfurtransferase
MHKSILFLLIILAAACNDSKTVQNVDGRRFNEILDSVPGAQIVDVRTPEEFGEGKIAGAVNIDWQNSSFAANAQGLNKNIPVLVYCRSGKRSAEAAKWFSDNGFRTVYQLEGGIQGWQAAGNKVDEPEPKPTAENANAAGTPNAVITPAQYAALIKSKPVVLVDFAAAWCGPCKMLAPRIAELEQEYPGMLVIRVNITALPTLMLYKDGEVAWRNVGLVDKSVIKAEIVKTGI